MTEHIPFTTIREDFNEYKTKNGIVLRSKQILTDVYEDIDKHGRSIGNVGSKTVSHVFLTKPIDTSKMEEVSSEYLVTDDDVIEELEFEIVKESIAIYETEKLIILFDPRVEKISLTNKKDKTGVPHLRFRTGMGLSVVPKRPDDDRKKPSF